MCDSRPKIRSIRTYSRSIWTPKSGEFGPKPEMSRLPQIRSIRTHGRTVRTLTGQTGPSDRSNRSYPNQKPRIPWRGENRPQILKPLLALVQGYIWMFLTRGNHLKTSRTRYRPSQAKIPWVSVSPAKNLDPPLPKEGIVEKKLPHAGLILPWPWNQVEREDLGLRVWVRGEGELGRGELSTR